jgi:hypothetical protein
MCRFSFMERIIMTARSRRVVAAMWLISAVASAQSDIAGKWTTEEQSDTVVVLQLSVKGSAVTGAVTVGESPAQAIADGKIDGNRLTFKTATMLNGKEVSVLWEGEAQDKKLTLVRSFGSSGRKLPPIVLQRSK